MHKSMKVTGNGDFKPPYPCNIELFHMVTSQEDVIMLYH